MKKAFISVYVLIILLIFGLSISFTHDENETNFNSSQSLYYKKVGMFEAESLLNIIINEGRLRDEKPTYDFIRSLDFKSSLSVTRQDRDNKIPEADGAKILTVNSEYEDTKSHASIAYRIDKEGKLKIIYKRVY